MSLVADPGCIICDGLGFDSSRRVPCECLRHDEERAQPVFHQALVDALTGDLPDPRGFVMDVGKHKGELISRVPICYLKWMVNGAHQYADIAEAELQRRGTELPELEVSAHALDRASLRLMPAWKGTRKKKEGLHSWLARIADQALENYAFRPGCHQFMGIVFVFAYDGRWPVLKSVWPAARGSEDDEEADYVA